MKFEETALKGSAIFYYRLEKFWRFPNDIDLILVNRLLSLSRKRKVIRKRFKFSVNNRLKSNEKSNFQYLIESKICGEMCSIRVECLVIADQIDDLSKISIEPILTKYARLRVNKKIVKRYPTIYVLSGTVDQTIIDKYLSIPYYYH